MGEVGVQQWQSNLYTRTFVDDNKNGIWDADEIGIPLVYTRIRYRMGTTPTLWQRTSTALPTSTRRSPCSTGM